MDRPLPAAGFALQSRQLPAAERAKPDSCGRGMHSNSSVTHDCYRKRPLRSTFVKGAAFLSYFPNVAFAGFSASIRLDLRADALCSGSSGLVTFLLVRNGARYAMSEKARVRLILWAWLTRFRGTKQWDQTPSGGLPGLSYFFGSEVKSHRRVRRPEPM